MNSKNPRIKTYRRKIEPVRAVLFDGSEESCEAIMDIASKHSLSMSANESRVRIIGNGWETVSAYVGDYVVLNASGKVTRCPAPLLDAFYEEVPNAE